MAERNIVMAKPERSKVISGTRVPTREMLYTTKIVISPAKKAEVGTMGKPSKLNPPPNNVASPAPTEEPEETHKT